MIHDPTRTLHAPPRAEFPRTCRRAQGVRGYEKLQSRQQGVLLHGKCNIRYREKDASKFAESFEPSLIPRTLFSLVILGRGIMRNLRSGPQVHAIEHDSEGRTPWQVLLRASSTTNNLAFPRCDKNRASRPQTMSSSDDDGRALL